MLQYLTKVSLLVLIRNWDYIIHELYGKIKFVTKNPRVDLYHNSLRLRTFNVRMFDLLDFFSKQDFIVGIYFA